MSQGSATMAGLLATLPPSCLRRPRCGVCPGCAHAGRRARFRALPLSERLALYDAGDLIARDVYGFLVDPREDWRPHQVVVVEL